MARKRLLPKSVEDVRDAVRAAGHAQTPLRIMGGDTLAGMGGATDATLVLATAHLRGLLAFEPQDLTCAVLAGTTLAALAAELAAQRLFVACDAPHPARATLGGTLAAGWLSPRRHRFGRARDAVIGTQLVLADARVAFAGGMVVKNVTGYDMSKLYVGSFGTLGILTQINLKLQSLPQRRRAILAPLPEGTRDRTCSRLRELDCEPSATLLVDGFAREIEGAHGAEGRVLVLLECTDTLLERATRDVRSALGKAGVPMASIIDEGAEATLQHCIDASIAGLGERSVTYRLLGRPTLVGERERTLRALARTHGFVAESLFDAHNGDLFVRLSARDARAFAGGIEALDEAVHALEPHAIVVNCEHAMRENLAVWGETPGAFEKMRAIKAIFDPKHLFNPGRFVGGL